MCGSRSVHSVYVLFCLLALLVACGEPVATPEPIYLRATGAMEMAPLVTELAAAFGEQQPTIDLEVTGLGSEYGLEALRSGETDIALLSWLPADLASASGQGADMRLRATAIARDGIAVVVHPGNSMDGLGLLQLQALFAGQIYEWRAMGGPMARGTVQPVSREKGSGARAAFETLVMDEQRVTPLAVVAPSPQTMVEYVASHPQAIGYVSMGLVSPEVKVLKVEGELPTPESVGRGSYALTRELWLVTTDPPPEGAQPFIDFVLSPSGQQIVGRRFGRLK
jgi:phosphate transport system substrate-binding protein